MHELEGEDGQKQNHQESKDDKFPATGREGEIIETVDEHGHGETEEFVGAHGSGFAGDFCEFGLSQEISHENAANGMGGDEAPEDYIRALAGEVEEVFQSSKAQGRRQAVNNGIKAIVELGMLPHEMHEHEAFTVFFCQSYNQEVVYCVVKDEV
jgi:hypothetical protein